MNKNIAIVTGGTSGLGFEIARCLLEKKINVCIIGRDKARLDSATSMLSNIDQGANVLGFQCDVGEEKQVQSLFEFLVSNELNVEMIFNVAGVGRFCDPNNINRILINTVFEANLIGLILMSSYGLKAMEVTGGKIINVMSTAALEGRPSEAVYCAAKWGARGFTEAIKEATKDGPIKVMAVYPGGMNTPFWSLDCGLSPDVSQFMKPLDVAKRIVDTALDVESSVVTDIIINRGQSL